MKKTLFLLMFLSLTIPSLCQKVDIDRYNYKVQYRDMPRKPLPPEYRTQIINVTGSEKIMHYLDKNDLIARADIPGFKRLSSGSAHVKINLDAGDLIVTDVRFPKSERINKDSDGKEIGRTVTYSIEAPFEWKASVTVMDFKDSVLGSYGDEVKDVITISKSFASTKSAAEHWNKNKADLIKEVIQKRVPSEIMGMCIPYQWRLGYLSKNENEFLWIVSSKKHPEFGPQQELIEKVKSAFGMVTLTDFPEESRTAIEEVISYFDDVPTRYPSDEKSDKKLRYASYYNKAKLYYWLDRPEDAVKEAEKLVANGFDTKDGEKIIEASRSLASSMKETKQTSRHFDPEKLEVSLPQVAGIVD